LGVFLLTLIRVLVSFLPLKTSLLSFLVKIIENRPKALQYMCAISSMCAFYVTTFSTFIFSACQKELDEPGDMIFAFNHIKNHHLIQDLPEVPESSQRLPRVVPLVISFFFMHGVEITCNPG